MVDWGFGIESPLVTPLYIESDYHSVIYEDKVLDIWMFTNSTKVNLHYLQTRLGQISIFLSWSRQILVLGPEFRIENRIKVK